MVSTRYSSTQATQVQRKDHDPYAVNEVSVEAQRKYLPLISSVQLSGRKLYIIVFT